MSDNECKFCSEHEAGDTLYECNGWDGGVSYDYIQDIKYCPLCGRKLGGVESLPSENQNGDAISRQAAIDTIENEQKKVMRSDWAIDQAKFSAMSEIRELIAQLPPVSTEKTEIEDTEGD